MSACLMTGCAGNPSGLAVAHCGIPTPRNQPPNRVGTMAARLTSIMSIAMKPSDPHRNLVAPTIQPNEARKHMRKLERALDTANEAV
uniref:Uncharacterized protein n=1 Tax=Candidatus Kentrum sp. TUN TaxID=2126343 RepID=A0A450ZP84_9GAMM|nr:MAG: hypothetical protein BECKTUN1418D_GA0071000_103411 [Candidatus Kentron sp. TUN]VFK56191.1 MAG: hypothetical protein BECKTUN1418F_GA0071002_10823 [Candidatus Kentron sp. TUN]VFK62431.1 MAG: hypothetical protein BECKTUN1418E_GA0071001_10803 [Candidatus Kentron sp. TUN]